MEKEAFSTGQVSL